jgi:hypothetical protein
MCGSLSPLLLWFLERQQAIAGAGLFGPTEPVFVEALPR